MIAISTPAQATAADCQMYLASMGYEVGPIVINNCDNVADSNVGTLPVNMGICIQALANHGVNPDHASEGCQRARW